MAIFKKLGKKAAEVAKNASEHTVGLSIKTLPTQATKAASRTGRATRKAAETAGEGVTSQTSAQAGPTPGTLGKLWRAATHITKVKTSLITGNTTTTTGFSARKAVKSGVAVGTVGVGTAVTGDLALNEGEGTKAALGAAADAANKTARDMGGKLKDAALDAVGLGDRDGDGQPDGIFSFSKLLPWLIGGGVLMAIASVSNTAKTLMTLGILGLGGFAAAGFLRNNFNTASVGTGANPSIAPTTLPTTLDFN